MSRETVMRHVRRLEIPAKSQEEPAVKLFGKIGTGSSDSYVKVLRKAIKDEPVSQKLKNYILENFDLFNYHGVELVILRSKNVGETSLYGGMKFVRHGNETAKV